MSSPRIISAPEPPITNKYIVGLMTIGPFIGSLFFVFKHFSLLMAICVTIVEIVALVFLLYKVITLQPKIVEMNEGKITFYGQPKNIVLSASDLKNIKVHEGFWNKMNNTVKLEVRTDQQTFYVTTKWFEFERLQAWLNH